MENLRRETMRRMHEKRRVRRNGFLPGTLRTRKSRRRKARKQKPKMINFDDVSKCRFCGQSILFVENPATGKQMPINTNPATGGDIVLRSKRFSHLDITAENLPKIKSFAGKQIYFVLRAEVLRFFRSYGGEPLFEFHYKTCPNKPPRRKTSRFGGKI